MDKKTVLEYVDRWENECTEIEKCTPASCGDYFECFEAMVFILHNFDLLRGEINGTGENED